MMLGAGYGFLDQGFVYKNEGLVDWVEGLSEETGRVHTERKY